jgi:hypothetical protein
MNLQQLQQLATSVGFPDPGLAAAVAMAESGGDPSAYGDAQYGGSVGLWQINLPAHPEYTAAELDDPTTNARAVYAISSGGTNWEPWTTYRTGAYLRWHTLRRRRSARMKTAAPWALLGGDPARRQWTAVDELEQDIPLATLQAIGAAAGAADFPMGSPAGLCHAVVGSRRHRHEQQSQGRELARLTDRHSAQHDPGRSADPLPGRSPGLQLQRAHCRSHQGAHPLHDRSLSLI